MAKLTLEQKRLETLRRQLQGKDPLAHSAKTSITRTHKPDSSQFQLENTKSYQVPSASYPTMALAATDQFLGRDLLKILILSILAIGAELILYFSLNHGFVHLF